MLMVAGGVSAAGASLMRWNKQPIPYEIALRIGWNLPIDVVGSGVYGGVVKRDEGGRIVIGDEWPEDNRAPPAHNPVHSTGPFLDFSKFTQANQGYAHITNLIIAGSLTELNSLFESIAAEPKRKKLANLVMTGGARPLHMCGMSRGGDSSALISMLIKFGADVNAKDNYELTPVDRLASNSVSGNHILRRHGGKSGHELQVGTPAWDSDEFVYTGPGETTP